MDWRIPLPKIRNINPTPGVHNEQPVYFLQDPLQISQTSILIPQQLGAIFMLCDGTRTLHAIHSMLISMFGIHTSKDDLKELFLAIDEAYLFKNNRFDEAHASALEAFRESPFRPAIHAGNSYPADAEELVTLLQGFQGREDDPVIDDPIRGVISPHIDFARGGSTYAYAWKPIKPIIDNFELVIIFGTDHHGTGEAFTLTRQDYATPFGILPTYQSGVDFLVDIYGEESLFAGELRHRTEHSIEFAAIWLQFLRSGEPCPILPILCDDLPVEENHEQLLPGSDSRMHEAIDAIRKVIQSKKTLIVAAGDLSHVGPAFGGQKVPKHELDELSETDHGLMKSIVAGDADKFHRLILSSENRSNVCGTAPIVNALKVLTPSWGDMIQYQQCPADGDETSWVSICAIHLH